MNKFLEALTQTNLDGSYLKWIKNIANHQVLILDDFGIKPLSHDARLAVLDILEDSTERELLSSPHNCP